MHLPVFGFCLFCLLISQSGLCFTRMFCRKLLSACTKCSELICSSECWKEVKKCCFLLQLEFIVVWIASSVIATQPTDGIAQSWSFSLAMHISAARCHQISHTGLPINSKSAAVFPAPFLVSAPPRLVPPVIHVNYAGSWAGCQTAWQHWQAIRQNRAGWQMARSSAVSCAL